MNNERVLKPYDTH